MGDYRHLGKISGYQNFNVGFGDIDPKSGKVNDLIVTDNKDREKVLATVVATAIEFTHAMHKCRLIVRGSTPARTRLYQMKIAAYYPEISNLFDIQGHSDLSNDPYFVKKDEETRAFLKRIGEVFEEEY